MIVFSQLIPGAPASVGIFNYFVIETIEAFYNAITTVLALGGSTNAVLHLLAIAHEAKVDLNIDVFDKLARNVPHLGDMKPFGKYHMVDLDKIGGVPVVSKILLENPVNFGFISSIILPSVV